MALTPLSLPERAPVAVRQQRWPMSRGAVLLLGAAFVCLWFGTLDLRHLIGNDEGWYAEVAREMLRSGDWITPRYNGYPDLRTPPLQSWLTAAVFAVFGVGDWQARLWPALSGLAGVAAVGYAGARVFHPTAGWLAAIVLAASPLWNLLAHYNSLDMGFAAMLTLALCAFLLAQRPEASATRARGWMLCCWTLLGLAVLSDGVAGIGLPALTVAVYSIWARDWRIWGRLYLISGMLVFLLIAAPWFVAMHLRYPGAFDAFVTGKSLEGVSFAFAPLSMEGEAPDAALSWSSFASRDSVFFYVPVIAVGMLPWLSMLIPAVPFAARLPRQTNRFSPALLLTAWAAVFACGYSIARAKAIPNVLPAASACALLIGLYLPTLTRRVWRRHLAGYAIVLVTGALGAMYLTNFGGDRFPNASYRHYQQWVWLSLGVALVCVAAAAWLTRLRRPGARRSIAGAGSPAAAFGSADGRANVGVAPRSIGVALTFGSAWLLACTIAGNAHEIFGKDSAGIAMVAPTLAALRTAPASAPFYSVEMLDPTLPFYLRRIMTLVAARGVLTAGVDAAPRDWIADLATWSQRWRAATAAFALMPTATYQQMRAEHLPMRVIAHDGRRVIVSRAQQPPAPKPVSLPAPDMPGSGVCPAAATSAASLPSFSHSVRQDGCPV